jgi:hypothetical protein
MHPFLIALAIVASFAAGAFVANKSAQADLKQHVANIESALEGDFAAAVIRVRSYIAQLKSKF